MVGCDGAATVGGAGAGAAAAGAGAAVAGFAAAGAGAGIVALTAVLQAGARLATFFCRQSRASLPPGVTPEHFDMKSERQFARMALCCSAVTCAVAVCASAASAIKAAPVASALRNWFGKVMASPLAAPAHRKDGGITRNVRPICYPAGRICHLEQFGCNLIHGTAGFAVFGVS